MTTEIERQFFDTFEIKPNNMCKYAKYGYEGSEGTWYFCDKSQKECWTYPSDTTCKDKVISYPQITDNILLELICIAHTSPIITFVSRDVKSLKEEVLMVLCHWVNNRNIKQQVQALFEEK